MAWKSTVTISRKRAVELIQARIATATDDQLASAVEGLGYGDEMDLDYYGRNFNVSDEEDERALYERLRDKYGD